MIFHQNFLVKLGCVLCKSESYTLANTVHHRVVACNVALTHPKVSAFCKLVFIKSLAVRRHIHTDEMHLYSTVLVKYIKGRQKLSEPLVMTKTGVWIYSISNCFQTLPLPIAFIKMGKHFKYKRHLAETRLKKEQWRKEKTKKRSSSGTRTCPIWSQWIINWCDNDTVCFKCSNHPYSTYYTSCLHFLERLFLSVNKIESSLGNRKWGRTARMNP